MKEILEKIKAVLANWHAHVDPQAAIQQHIHDFMVEVHREIEGLKVGLDADAAEFVHGEMEKLNKAVVQYFDGMQADMKKMFATIESRLAALESPKQAEAEQTIPGDAPKAE